MAWSGRIPTTAAAVTTSTAVGISPLEEVTTFASIGE